MNLAGEPVYVGRDFGGRELTIDTALVERYCEALEEEPSRYAQTAPGLVLHSECYEDFDWYLANIYGNLHARQEWELFRPIPVGARVRTRAFARDRYRKRGRDYVVKETWALDEEGRLCSRGLTHQSFLVDDGSGSQKGDVVGKDREKRGDRRFETGGGDGRLLEPLVKTASEAVCMAFSGPEKNYHNDRDKARELGFPDIVVQGMLATCYMSELLTREFGDGWLAGGKMDVKLVNVLWANETVHARGQVREEVPEADRKRVHMDAWVEKEDGTKVIVGTASAVA